MVVRKGGLMREAGYGDLIGRRSFGVFQSVLLRD